MDNKKDVIQFLEKHADLIEAENFVDLYNAAQQDDDIWPALLTEVLWNADIDPMQYFHGELPGHFAEGLSIEKFEVAESISTICDRAFKDCYKLTSVKLPNSLTAIRYKAFNSCSKLTEINFPEGLTTIEKQAFEWCTNLKKVCLPDSLTTLEMSAFDVCSSIEEVAFGNGLTSIPFRAFAGGHGLTSLTLPASINYIGRRAFEDCSITDLTFLGTTLPDMVATAFAHNPIKHITFNGTMKNWMEEASIRAFDSEITIEVSCIDGEVIKNSGTDEIWRVK